MGLQNGKGVEMNLSAETTPTVSSTTVVSDGNNSNDHNQSDPSTTARETEGDAQMNADRDGDIVLGDVKTGRGDEQGTPTSVAVNERAGESGSKSESKEGQQQQPSDTEMSSVPGSNGSV